MTVSPAQPSYLEYHIPADVWSVIVRAESGDDLCGVMSLQELKVSTSSSFPCFFANQPLQWPFVAVVQLRVSVCICLCVPVCVRPDSDFGTE